MTQLIKKPLFNPGGDTDVRLRRMIGGNTTNLNDFNNMRYAWVSDWYRQAMNNFWIPEEINLAQDTKDYPNLSAAERTAYDKILSFLVFLDSIQTANLPNIGEYVTANEVNLCLSIQAFQECVHSQSYSYMLDSICSPVERNDILYQWKTDEHLLRRNTFIGDLYNEFQQHKDPFTLLKVMMANYILEGIYFYSGFMFFYNLARNGKMPGSAQEIRYINRDENTHLWLFRNILLELQKEEPELFSPENVQVLKEMLEEGVRQEIAWGHYVIGDAIPGLTKQMVTDYIRYLGNLRWTGLGFGPLFEDNQTEPASMSWVSQYSNANMVKTDFFEAKSTRPISSRPKAPPTPRAPRWWMTFDFFNSPITAKIPEGISLGDFCVVSSGYSSGLAQSRLRPTALCQPASSRARLSSAMSGAKSTSQLHRRLISSVSFQTPTASPAR